ncbi:hypothetical protein [Nocardioides sp.]|uniref:hypothetical protein n=1 Tax=Nocardioides sp. TaxID=35761 RepID=UPI0037830AF8
MGLGLTLVGAPASGGADPSDPRSVVSGGDPINLRLAGASRGDRDLIEVRDSEMHAGLSTSLWVGRTQVASKALNASGDAAFSRRDRNGNRKTTYTVKVAATDTTNRAAKSITIK